MTDAHKCVMCGMCKARCPVFRATHNELYSPRGKAMLLKEEKESATFYMCTLCGACTEICASDVDFEVQKVRRELVRKGIETEANKKMIENVRKYGNPFGKE
ncbi:MAG: 4Fe-4S dicluster domain-containing protein [Candidatus Woesearchaeota archaeon]